MNAKAVLAAKLAGAALTLASIAFLAISFFRLDFSGLPRVAGIVPWLAALALSACYALTVGVQGLAWHSTLSFLAPVKPRVSATLSAYARANIGKYLPGNVMHFVGRNYFGARLGLSQADMAMGTALEIASLALTAAFLSIACAAASGSLAATLDLFGGGRIVFIAGAAVVALLALALLAAFAASGKLRRALYRIGARLSAAKKRSAGRGFRGRAPAYLLALYSLYVLNFLIHASVIVAASRVFLGTSLSVDKAIALSAAYLAAWLVGFVVPGPPGGIGVREAAFLMLAGPLLGPSGALALAAVSRAICVAGDGLAYAAALAVRMPPAVKK